jgi:nucleotide-binding universal stress UspA family protein
VHHYNALGAGDIPYVPSADVIEKTIYTQSKQQMAQLLTKINRLPYNTKHNFVTLVDYNFLIDTIKEHIIQKKIDLLVMGTKGASGLKEAVIGTNTGEVITRIQCPTFVIPENATYTGLAEIAFPTDYNMLYNTKTLTPLLEIANLHLAAIRVLHVRKKEEKLISNQLENKELLEGYLKDLQHSSHILTNKNVEDSIECFTESRDIDMIAMVAKNLNFIQRVLFKPTVENISYHTKVPFLVLHE